MKNRWPQLLLLSMLIFVGAAGANDPPRTEPILFDPDNLDSITRSAGIGQRVPAHARDRSDLLSEGFEESVPPVEWTIITTGEGYTWAQSSSYHHDGAHSAYIHRGAPGQWEDEWLVTPAIDLTNASHPQFEFYERELYWTLGLRHSILVSTTVPDDPDAFTTILLMTPGDHVISQWQNPMVLDLSDYAGNSSVYVAFRYEGLEADNWYVDDVRVFDPASNDAAAISVAPSAAIFGRGEEVVPQCTVRNVGLNTVSFDVRMQISHNDIPFYDEVESVSNLAFPEYTTVDFPPFTATVGYYALTATTLLPGDEDPANDTAEARSECYSGARTPLGILYTNWACGPCVPANQALDEWYPLQGDDACLIRVHVYWPDAMDPIYTANPEESLYLLRMTPQQVTGVPWLYMDNYINVYDLEWNWGWPDAVEVAYAASEATPSPLSIAINYHEQGSRLRAAVRVFDLLNPAGDYRLFVAVTEDSIHAHGPNGEDNHMQAFRRLYPNAEGLPIDTAIGEEVYYVDIDLDPLWVYDQLRATVFVRDLMNGPVLNSATTFLSDSEWPADIDETARLDGTATSLRITGANPFHPQTLVSFALPTTQEMTLVVYDTSGRRVATLAAGTVEAGEHTVAWDGKDSAGHAVGSGTYVISLNTGGPVESRKVTLLR